MPGRTMSPSAAGRHAANVKNGFVLARSAAAWWKCAEKCGKVQDYE
jgi:hypothetical protein